MKPALTFSAALAALLCVGTVSAAQPPGSEGTLQAAVSYPAGPYPWSVAIGDFNRDGAADLAVTNLGSRVSVLLGTGDGGFRAPVGYPAGWYPWTVAVGDFNGDHNDDLVVGNSSDNISVLMGQGDGTFGAPVHYAAGSHPVSIAVGDFDRNGSTDLAVATTTRSGVRVLLSNGDGTFQAGVGYGQDTYPWSVAVSDFNGDGKADLGVSSTAGGGIHVLLGHGDGTFQDPTRLAATGGASLAVGDFNGDGTADLAAADTSRPNVGVLLGNGDGTFQAEVRYGPDLLPLSVAAGDLNADNKDDLLVVTFALIGKSGVLHQGELGVLLAADGGTFLPAVHYGVGAFPRSLVVGDFNRDGRTDVAVANSTSFDVRVLLNGPVTPTTTMHVGDVRAHAKLALDGAKWQAQVLVRAERANHVALPATIVSGTWEDGSVARCVTNLNGVCVLTRLAIPAGVATATFTVTGLANPTYAEHVYDAAGNHDAGGDSDGTSVVIVKPARLVPEGTLPRLAAPPRQ